MLKKSAKSQKPQTAKAAAKRTIEEMSDEQLHALRQQHRKSYERLLTAKKKADADFKNGCKLAKAEIGDDAVDQIKIDIDLDTDEGEAKLRAQVQRTLWIARWRGVALGTQAELFTDEPLAPGEREFAEGKRASANNEPRKPPDHYAPDSASYRRWMDGYQKDQERIAEGFKAPPESEGELPAEMRDFGTAPIGTAPATHTIS